MLPPQTLTLWVREQAWPLGIILFLVLAAFLLVKYSSSRRHRMMNAARANDSEETFVRNLQAFGFDPAITATTYRYLQEVQLVSFPILATDALDEDLGLDSADVDQSVRELLVALGRHEAPGLRYEPLLTVEDLVRHIQASPRKRVSIAA